MAAPEIALTAAELERLQAVRVRRADSPKGDRNYNISLGLTRLPRPPGKRQLEVLALVAEGFDNDEIGKRMFISTETVKGHLKRVTQKLNGRNRAHLVAIALRTGLIE